MRLLFTSAQLPGHLDWGGYLATAAVLTRRGHAVCWASGDAVRDLVQARGVPFHPLAETGWRWPPPPPLAPPAPGDGDWQQLRMRRALDQWLDATRVATAVEALLAVARAFGPDLVVAEQFVAAAGLVAELVEVPFVVAGWPARPPGAPNQEPLVVEARQRLAELLARFGASGANWTTAGPPALLSHRLHLTYWSPSWYDGVTLAAQTAHCGGRMAPAAPPDPSLPPPDERPWVLITLGTSFNEDPTFFVAAATAADRLGCLPIVVLGREPPPPAQAAWLGRLPANACVRTLVRFEAILPYLAAAIHHGGAGTTHALVTHAVPQVVVPHAAEQAHQAHGIVRSGVGLYIPPKQVTVPVLQEALAALLPDLAVRRANAQALQAEFAALGGVERAADLLEQIV